MRAHRLAPFPLRLFLVILFSTLSVACAGRHHPPPSTGLSAPPSDVAPEPEEAGLPSEGSPESPYLPLDRIREGAIVHIPTGVAVDQTKLMEDLASARVIYVGEVHDSAEDHRVQFSILKGLVERFPGKVSVGMEMFRHTSQKELDAWVRGELPDKAFLKVWYRDWGMDEAVYHDLLDYIRSQRIPLIGLNASDDLVRAVSQKGFEGLTAEEKERLPEIDRSDLYHRLALRVLFKGHGVGAENFEGFYDTMLLWDETMAESLARYLATPEGKDRKLVAFAGGFHFAYGFGVPRRTFRRVAEPYRIVMPHSKEPPSDRDDPQSGRPRIEGEIPDLPLPYADFVWGVSYTIATGSRVRLGVQIEPDEKGVRITGVFPGSVADAAGLKRGDIVLRFDGAPVGEPFDLTYAVQQKNPGDKGTLALLREGAPFDVEVTFRASRHP
jgi:uncharacterized iron-regulated protein